MLFNAAIVLVAVFSPFTGRCVWFCIVAVTIGSAIPVIAIGVFPIIVPVSFLISMVARYPATAVIVIIAVVIDRGVRVGVTIPVPVAVPRAIVIIIITIAIINNAAGKANGQSQYRKNFFHVEPHAKVSELKLYRTAL